MGQCGHGDHRADSATQTVVADGSDQEPAESSVLPGSHDQELHSGGSGVGPIRPVGPKHETSGTFVTKRIRSAPTACQDAPELLRLADPTPHCPLFG